MSATAERTGVGVEDPVVGSCEAPLFGAEYREGFAAAHIVRVRALEARVRLDVVVPVRRDQY